MHLMPCADMSCMCRQPPPYLQNTPIVPCVQNYDLNFTFDCALKESFHPPRHVSNQSEMADSVIAFHSLKLLLACTSAFAHRMLTLNWTPAHGPCSRLEHHDQQISCNAEPSWAQRTLAQSPTHAADIFLLISRQRGAGHCPLVWRGR